LGLQRNSKADAADGLDKAYVGRVASQLSVKTTQVDVDVVCVRGVPVRAPHGGDETLPRRRCRAFVAEHTQQGKFNFGDRDRVIVDSKFSSSEVDDEGAESRDHA